MPTKKWIIVSSVVLLASCATNTSTLATDNTRTQKLPRANNHANPNVVEHSGLTNKKQDTMTNKTEKASPSTSKSISSDEPVLNSKTNKESTKTSLRSDEAAKIGATASATAVTSWDISGAMAARSNNKGWNASVNWLQRGTGQYQIRLFGPLGSGTVLINKNGNTVTLRDGPKSSSSTNADELLKQQTGIRLPVGNLYYWVRGLPAPGSIQSVKRDSSNRILQFKQAGYSINYGQYTAVGSVALPNKITLQGNGVFIKFVIKRWKI